MPAFAFGCRLVVLLLPLAACDRVSWLGGGAEPVAAPSSEVCDPARAPTWESFGAGFVATWCLPCHSSDLDGPDRGGAPAGVDFDTRAAVVAQLEAIRTWAAAPDATMPPAGGVSEAEREQLRAWLACGAPGDDEPLDACALATPHPGDLRVGSGFACEESVVVGGDLRVEAAAELPCVCAVEGEVRLTGGGEVGLPALTEVGGSVVVGADVAVLSAPALRTVGGDLSADGAAGLVALDLGELATVGGAVRIRGAGLRTLSLPELVSVGGDLAVQGDLTLEELELFRLASVGGDLRITGSPRLLELDSLDALEWVGGDLLLAELHGLDHLDRAFFGLMEVGGTLEVRDNPALVGMDPFPFLATVGGDLRISGNDGLRRLDGLYVVGDVAGDLEIRDNPSLPTSDAHDVVRRIGPEAVGGAIVVSGNGPG